MSLSAFSSNHQDTLSTQAYSITNLELSLHNKNEDKKTPIQVHLGYHTHYNSSRDCVLLVK